MVEFAYKLQLHYDIYLLVFPIWMVKIIKMQILTYIQIYLLVITYIWFQLHDITYKLQYNYRIL